MTVHSHSNQQSINSNNQAIGIFDSGVGGLSIAKRIKEQLPNEKLIYVADSLYAPYGDMNRQQIADRVNVIADKLLKMNVKAIVVACNTATVNAVELLRSRINIPIIGVEPAIKPAAQNSEAKKIALLVTQATAENKRFQALVERHKNGCEVIIQSCPGLVELVERNQLSGEEANTLVNKYLTPVMNKGVDHIVLGCTHYPFLLPTINASLPKDIKVIETSVPVTNQLVRKLQELDLVNQGTHLNQTAQQNHSSESLFFTTDATLSQQQLFDQLWLSDVHLQLL